MSNIQRTSIKYGNDAVTSYTYNASSRNLSNLSVNRTKLISKRTAAYDLTMIYDNGYVSNYWYDIEVDTKKLLSLHLTSLQRDETAKADNVLGWIFWQRLPF